MLRTTVREKWTPERMLGHVRGKALPSHHPYHYFAPFRESLAISFLVFQGVPDRAFIDNTAACFSGFEP